MRLPKRRFLSTRLLRTTLGSMKPSGTSSCGEGSVTVGVMICGEGSEKGVVLCDEGNVTVGLMACGEGRAKGVLSCGEGNAAVGLMACDEEGVYRKDIVEC